MAAQMASLSSQRLIEDENSSLADLASFLNGNTTTQGRIDIPGYLEVAITQLIQLNKPLPSDEVTSVVQAMSFNKPSICSRLGSKAFIILFAILRKAKYCWAQQRGLCLLTEALREERPLTPAPQPLTISNGSISVNSRKTIVGKEILHLSLRQFCNHQIHDRARRWMGLLSLELLKDNKENQAILDKLGEKRQSLGQIITDETNGQLRLIAGSLVRELVMAGLSIMYFWPEKTHASQYKGFPKNRSQSPQWMVDFDRYVNALDLQNQYANRNFACFAYSLQVDKRRFESSTQQPAAFITVYDTICMFIPAAGAECDRYIDILPHNVTGVEVLQRSFDDQASTAIKRISFEVIIYLQSNAESTMYVNALGKAFSLIKAAFDNFKIAEELQIIIEDFLDLAKRIRTVRAVQAEPLDLSASTGNDHITAPPVLVRNSQKEEEVIRKAPAVKANIPILECDSKQPTAILNEQKKELRPDLSNMETSEPGVKASEASVISEPLFSSQVVGIEVPQGIEPIVIRPAQDLPSVDRVQLNGNEQSAKEVRESSRKPLSDSLLDDVEDRIYDPPESIISDREDTNNGTGYASHSSDGDIQRGATVTKQLKLSNRLRDCNGQLMRVTTFKPDDLSAGLTKMITYSSTTTKQTTSNRICREERPSLQPPLRSRKQRHLTLEDSNSNKIPGQTLDVFDIPNSPFKLPQMSSSQQKKRNSVSKSRPSKPKSRRGLMKRTQSSKAYKPSSTAKNELEYKLRETKSRKGRKDMEGEVKNDAVDDGKDITSQKTDMYGGLSSSVRTQTKSVGSSSTAVRNTIEGCDGSVVGTLNSIDTVSPSRPRQRTAAINASRKIHDVYKTHPTRSQCGTFQDIEKPIFTNNAIQKPLKLSKKRALDRSNSGEQDQHPEILQVIAQEPPKNKLPQKLPSKRSGTPSRDRLRAEAVITEAADVGRVSTLQKTDGKRSGVGICSATANNIALGVSNAEHKDEVPPIDDYLIDQHFNDAIAFTRRSSDVEPEISFSVDPPASFSLQFGHKKQKMTQETDFAQLVEVTTAENTEIGADVGERMKYPKNLAAQESTLIPRKVETSNDFVTKLNDALSGVSSHKLLYSASRVHQTPLADHGPKVTSRVPESSDDSQIVSNGSTNVSSCQSQPISNDTSSEKGEDRENHRKSIREALSSTCISSYAGKKRKLPDIVQGSAKRMKDFQIIDSKTSITAAQIINRLRSTVTIEKTASNHDFQHKVALLGLSVEDTRNQRGISNQKSRLGPVISPVASAGSYQKVRIGKRKQEEEDESHARPPHGVCSLKASTKLPKNINNVPLTPKKELQKNIQKVAPIPFVLHQKPGSQITRVNEFGSPIASADQVRKSSSGFNAYQLMSDLGANESQRVSVSAQEENAFDGSNIDIRITQPEGELPKSRLRVLRRENSLPLRLDELLSSSNTKAVPSSPTAPSGMLEAMTAHHVHHGGSFVNIKTADVVQPVEPRDPFVSDGPTPQNSFLRLLRGANVNQDSEEVLSNNNLQENAPSKGTMPNMTPEPHPNIALAGAEFGRHPQPLLRRLARESSSPGSGNRDSFMTIETVENDEQAERDRVWRDSLQPHQKDTLRSLYQISNRLVRRLIDKENAVIATAQDYATRGSKLIEALDKTIDERKKHYEAQVTATKKRLKRVFLDAESKLDTDLKVVTERRIDDLGREIRATHEHTMNGFEAVLAAFDRSGKYG